MTRKTPTLETDEDKIEVVAKEICLQRSAANADAPCWTAIYAPTNGWPPKHCEQPTCHRLAKGVLIELGLIDVPDGWE